MSIRVQVDALWNFKAVIEEARETRDSWREEMFLNQARLAWNCLVKELKSKERAMSLIGNWDIPKAHREFANSRKPLVSPILPYMIKQICKLIIKCFQEKNNKRPREEEDNCSTYSNNQQGSSKNSQGTSAKGMRMTKEMKSWGPARLKRFKAMQEVAKLGKQIQMGLDWAKSLDKKNMPKEREETP